MTDALPPVTIGYDEFSMVELVDKHLKSATSLSPREQSYLQTYPREWYAQLIDLKKRTEFQLTSSRVRQFSLYRQKVTGQLNQNDYIDKLHTEKSWRCNAIRYVQQIETQINHVKGIMK